MSVNCTKSKDDLIKQVTNLIDKEYDKGILKLCISITYNDGNTDDYEISKTCFIGGCLNG